MRVTSERVRVGVVAACVWLVASAVAAQTAAFQGPTIEALLSDAAITDVERLEIGVTEPRRVTLEAAGVVQHAAFKDIDVFKAGLSRLATGPATIDFQDSWKVEIPAYELDKLLGLGMVPATVEREVEGRRGSLQFWVDDVISEAERVENETQPPDVPAWNEQMHKVHLFENLTYNTDMHLRNVLITRDWKIVLIDFSRAFRSFGELQFPDDLTRFSRPLLARLEALDQETLEARMGEYLRPAQIDGILERRDLILERARMLVAEQGEAAVLYP